MQLKYRGSNYNTDASLIEVENGPVGGKYRGQYWRTHTCRNQPVAQHSRTMIYRGVKAV
ncbi:MAG: DUF4278 domain-containing protein [Microcoleaceae cyanobacterium]